MLEMETKHQTELEGIRSEKERLQRLVSRQSNTIEDLEKSLHAASSNTSLLQRQQLQLLESVRSLVQRVSQGRGEACCRGPALPLPRTAGGSKPWVHPPFSWHFMGTLTPSLQTLGLVPALPKPGSCCAPPRACKAQCKRNALLWEHLCLAKAVASQPPVWGSTPVLGGL